MVMDLVESTRLMAADERAVIDHWRGFVRAASANISRHGGRMVKSLGDGIMAEFESPREAAAVAVAMHRHFDAANSVLPTDSRLYLRAGLHATSFYADDIDIYGSGVNLAARVAGLAGPGETIVTSEVRDGLVEGLDAQLEDMGECHLKHVPTPVRTYRVGPVGPNPSLRPAREYLAPLQPTIAVIPFVSRKNEPEQFAIGELLADGIIGLLGRTADLRVISRLSCTVFRNRATGLSVLTAHLDASYVLTGSYVLENGRLLVNAEFVDAHRNEVIATFRESGAVRELLDADNALVGQMAAGVHRAVLNTEVGKAAIQPLPSLESCTLMLGAISLMHRLSDSDFERSRVMLEHLIDRHPKYGTPKAWLGRWHNLAVAQGRGDPGKDIGRSFQLVRQALDVEPGNAFALSVKGLLHGYTERRFDLARDAYAEALASNPNEPLAWIGRATLSTWEGDSAAAVGAADHALSLSPLDPIRYYFQSMAAVPMLAAGHYDKAIALATQSLRLNRMLSATYKTLAEAQYLNGDRAAARETVQGLMAVEPEFTVERFRASSPLYLSPIGRDCAEALLDSGVPAR